MDLNDLVKNPEQIKGLITILQTLLDSQGSQSDDTDEQPQPTKKRPRNTAKSTKKQKTNQRENKFLGMPEKNLHKEDTEIDRKLNKLPPTPRTRRFQNIKATCRVCGKTETINPSYMTMERDRYKCNKCSGAAG